MNEMNIPVNQLRTGNIVQTCQGKLITINKPGNMFCTCLEHDGLYATIGIQAVPLSLFVFTLMFNCQIYFEDGYEELELFKIGDLSIIFDKAIGALIMKNDVIINCISSFHEFQNVLSDNNLIGSAQYSIPKLKICQSL